MIFVNDTTGFIIGPHGFYSSKDTGNTWIEVHTKGLIYGMYYSTLFAINENAVWVCNDRGIYKTNGSIVNWQKAIIDNSDGNEEFLAIFAPSVNIVYAMAKNKVFKSINGGDNFFLLKTFDEKFFYGDVHFINDLTGYICSGPYIYKTIDGGATWTKVVTVGNGGITEIHFTDANHGWACTDRGAVLILSNKL